MSELTPYDDIARHARTALHAFADALVDPCILLDRRSAVIHANAAAQRDFPAARVGEPIGLTLRNPVILAAIEAVRRNDRTEVAELHSGPPAEAWHRLVVAPLKVEAEPGLLVLTLRNRTEEKRAEQMRSDFIANVSHELRTPLTSLSGFIDTLLGPAAQDRAARERFLAIMRTQAGRMSKLIEDLLSLSRIEMRQHVRPTGAVDLGRLLREVSEGLAGQARAAGVAVAIEAPDQPATVTGDRDELYEVFENLLENAIKYGDAGGRVEMRLAPAGRPGFACAVEVIDHGAGIAAEHGPRLTERFYRVDAESSRKKMGTGLGLAIVKHIVQRHRGSLTIKSRPGEGTRVEVLLPE
jgi:two-component system phosphate regulon sensor histidine kinase PhoR